MRRHHRPRLAEFAYKGQFAYHLVVVTTNREPCLIEHALEIASRLKHAAMTEGFDLLAFTIMPDHLHVLAHGTTDNSDAIAFMKRFKQTTSYDFIRGQGRGLWQQSFFDHVLRRDEDAHALATYIANNPVRAGLVERFEDWPHAGGSLLAGE
jgi:REP element-mobilizing transposase RayT